MKQRIELRDTEARKEICRALGITHAALSYALSFKRNSPRSHQARQMAIEAGGILMEEKPLSRTMRILNARGETERTIQTNNI